MFEIFGFIIPLIVILVIVGIFLSFVPLGLWISAVSAGVRVNIFSLVGMRLFDGSFLSATHWITVINAASLYAGNSSFK